MLDEIFDLFERDKKRGAAKQDGVRGLLSRLGGGDDRREYDESKRRYDDDDDDREHRAKPHKKRHEFDFFGDD